MIPPDAIAAFLPRQRWFGAKDRAIDKVDLIDVAVLKDDFPMLVRTIVEVGLSDGDAPWYHLLVGIRPAGQPAEFLHTHDDAVLGEVETPSGLGFAYDAAYDAELGLALLGLVAPGEEAQIVRPVGVEQSNTSLVYDDRLILKAFRLLSEGPNPDVEITAALAGQGFAHVAEPVATWQWHDRDLAIVQRFLAGGVEGWSLALTSLRDLFAMLDTQQLPVIRPDEELPAPPGPEDAGGDFAAEAERLGLVTAELHTALARAFGRQLGDAAAWAEPMATQLARTNHPDLDRGAVQGLLSRLRAVTDPGPAIRIHGDYHLGQVLRTDTGWYILDFEGEPARPLAERRAPSSPLKDVAGMLRSFHYAAQVALRERMPEGEDPELARMAEAWTDRNRHAFLDGYLPAAIDAGLVPNDERSLDGLLAAFELDKAVYELAYELSHRPDWVGIPLSAIRYILETS